MPAHAVVALSRACARARAFLPSNPVLMEPLSSDMTHSSHVVDLLRPYQVVASNGLMVVGGDWPREPPALFTANIDI